MTEAEYGSAKINLLTSSKDFTNNNYIKSFIPNQISKSIEELVSYFLAAQSLVFDKGKIIKLSIFNLIAWYKFLKLSYKFVTKIVEIWK